MPALSRRSMLSLLALGHRAGLDGVRRCMGLALVAMAFTSACVPPPDFPQDDQEQSEPKNNKKSKRNKSEDQDEPDKKKKKKNQEPEPFVPSPLKVKFTIEGDLPKDGDLRLVVQPDLGLTLEQGGLETPLVEKKAKFKKGQLSVTIPPLDDKLEIGRIGFAFLLTTLYLDQDESEDFSKGDTIIAAAANTPIYARACNFAGIGEWTRFDLESGDMVKITGSIALERLDDLETRERLTLSGKDEDIAKGIDMVASLSVPEYRDLEQNFSEVARNLELALDPALETKTFEISGALDEARRLAPEDSEIVVKGIHEVGLELLGGLKAQGEAVSNESQFLALGCIRRPHGGSIFYDPVGLLWITPDPHWITSPSGAFEALASELSPGWNAVVAMERSDGTIATAPLLGKLPDELVFSKDCSFESPTWASPRPRYTQLRSAAWRNLAPEHSE